MGWVSLSKHKCFLMLELSALQAEMMKLSREKINLHKYGASIADGKITFRELSEMPKSVMPLAWNYANRAHIEASQAAAIDSNFLAQQWIAQRQQQGNPFSPQEEQYMKYQTYKNQLNVQLAEAKKIEEQRIKVIEDEIDQKMQIAKDKSGAITEEMKSIDQAIKADQERTASKYA